MKDYNLKFIEIETGKEFRGKKIIANHFSIVMSEEPFKTEQFTEAFLRKRFKSAKGNHLAAKRDSYSRPRMFSARTMTKEFRDYLRGEENSLKENAS